MDQWLIKIMFQATKSKITAYGILILFIIYALILAFNADSWAEQTKNSSDYLFSYLIYLFGDPHTIIMIVGGAWLKVLTHGKRGINYIKGALAGFFLAMAADFVSFVHCLPASKAAYDQISSNLYLCSDTILTRPLIQSGIDYTTVWFSYYVILPAILVFVSIQLLKEEGFVNKVTNFVK